jgi:diaminopimelate epimerase
MKIPFIKYSGSGNDFIIIDNRNESFNLSKEHIVNLCKRREGIGADGVVFLNPSVKGHDFSFRIWNADGSEAEMCGNASRSIVHYASTNLKMKESPKYTFDTMNGVYEGEIVGDEVRIKMTELFDLGSIDISDLSTKASLYLNTGVPHACIQVTDVEQINIKTLGSAIRFDERFGKSGTNVDFFQVVDADKKLLKLRVFERGVEDETLCCGTGIMATAIAAAKSFNWEGEITIEARGGILKAIVDKEFKNLYFQGKVTPIYEGIAQLNG